MAGAAKVHPLLQQFSNRSLRLCSISFHAPPRVCRRYGPAPVLVTPNQTAIRVFLDALGLGERYEFWLGGLVRINESEAARAGRQSLPLSEFSTPDTITREPIPAIGDLTPMRWYWEFWHYRKETGDLILDRVLKHSEPSRQRSGRFWRSSDRTEHRCAHCPQQGSDQRVDRQRIRARIGIAAGSAKGGRRFSHQDEANCWSVSSSS